MKTTHIVNMLEMDELEYLKQVNAQIQDNLDGINELANKAKADKTEISLNMVIYELDRLAERHESLFNLSRQLADDAETKVQTAVALLLKSGGNG